MLSLSNGSLAVTLLDPRVGKARLSPRYCSGGHVLQVRDLQLCDPDGSPDWPEPSAGDLLTSVAPPAEPWVVGDGQGLPDSFSHRPLTELPTGIPSEDASPSSHQQALHIGVGMVDTVHNALIEPCAWTVEQTYSALCFRTAQTLGGYSLELTRTVTLIGRTVRVETELRNTGTRRIPIVWRP